MAVVDGNAFHTDRHTLGSFKTDKQLLLANGMFCVDISVLISVIVTLC